jgi:opacity protein-like surface antigen
MSQRTALSTLIAILAAVPALAEDEDFARSGFYAGVNAAGTAYLEVDGDVQDGLEAIGYAPDPDSDEPVGMGVRGGYRFHPHFAGEAQFQWYSHSKTTFSGYVVPDPDDDVRDVRVLRIESLNFTGNAKGYLLTGRFQPFILAGCGLIQYDVEDKIGIGMASDGVDFVGRFGGGLDIYFNEHIVITLDSSYLLPTGGASGLDQIQVAVGLNYRF